MFIARKKKKENIFEYLLYMWQVEDIIRFYQLNLDKIEKDIVAVSGYNEAEKKKLLEWYDSLIDMMSRENKQEKGHIQMIHNTIIELDDLHLQIMKASKETTYHAAFYKIVPLIEELKNKNKKNTLSEVETCFTAVYGYLLLKMQNKTITDGTNEAIKEISTYLMVLADFYKRDKNGEIDWEE